MAFQHENNLLETTNNTVENQRISDGKTWVIKVGTEILTIRRNTNIGSEIIARHQRFHSLSRMISQIKLSGSQVVLVSSGAVACGRMENQKLDREMLCLESSSDNDQENSTVLKALKQRSAAIGQVVLADLWRRAFRKVELYTEQILVDDHNLNIGIESIGQNISRTDSISIINANDALATSSLKRCADNDHLAKLIAQGINADFLVFITQSSGVLDFNKQLIHYLSAKNKSLVHDHGKTSTGSGGIISKVLTARQFAENGSTSIITNHLGLGQIIQGKQSGTWIYD